MPKPEDTGPAASKPGTPRPALRPSTGLGEGQK